MNEIELIVSRELEGNAKVTQCEVVVEEAYRCVDEVGDILRAPYDNLRFCCCFVEIFFEG